MKRFLGSKLVFSAVFIFLWSNEVVSAQVEQIPPKQVNASTSQNPKTKTKSEETEAAPPTYIIVISENLENKVQVETN